MDGPSDVLVDGPTALTVEFTSPSGGIVPDESDIMQTLTFTS